MMLKRYKIKRRAATESVQPHQDHDYNLKEILYAKNAEEVDSMLSDVIANAKNYEKNLIKKAKKEARDEAYAEKLEIAKSLLDTLDVETISTKFNITVEEIETLRETIESENK